MELPILEQRKPKLRKKKLHEQVVGTQPCLAPFLLVSGQGIPPMKLTRCMLVTASLLPCVWSFASHQIVYIGSCLGSSTRRRAEATPSSAWGASVGVRARRPLRLASQNQQDDGDGLKDVSKFEQTSGPVKAFVGGLTNLFVSLSPGEGEGSTPDMAQNKVMLNLNQCTVHVPSGIWYQ